MVYARGFVDDMTELGLQFAPGLGALGPANGHVDLGPTVIRGNLLCPRTGRAEATAQPLPAAMCGQISGPPPLVQGFEHVRD